MNKQEFIYIIKSIAISYLPILLVGIGVNYIFTYFNWANKSSLSYHLIFPVIIIFLVSIINIWNVNKRVPALLKIDNEPLLPAQATLNTILLILSLFLIILALKFIGVTIEGKERFDINNTSDVWFDLFFIGIVSIATLMKKLRTLRNQL